MFKSKSMEKVAIEKSNLFYIFLLFLIFLISEIIIHPIGNFPLNDDWFYAKKAISLGKTDAIVYLNWGYASMLTHLLYGKLFISAFGFSHTVLRFSTLIMSFIGIIFFNLLLIKFCYLKCKQAFFISVLILVNPLFLSLSNSYMTDVPFVTCILGSLFFYGRFYNNEKVVYYLLAILFLIWALLIRQLAISFIIGIFVADCFISKKWQWGSLFAFLLAIITLFIFENWLNNAGTILGYPFIFFKNYSAVDSISILDMIINFLKRWIHYISFSGFVLIPFLLPYLVYYFRNTLFIKHKKQFIISVVLLLPVIWSLQKFPIGDYLYNCGVGAETLYDTYILRINNQHGQSTILFLGIWLMSLIGSFSLLLILTQFLFLVFSWNSDQFKKNRLVIYLCTSLFFYYSFLAMASPIFDRYLMVFSILIIPLLLTIFNPMIEYKKLFMGLLLVLSGFSVLTNKDYLMENRMKWVAINDLKTNLHVSDSDINGGKEHAAICFGTNTWWFTKWNNIPENKFIISHGGITNYHYFKSYSYQRYIPFKADTIFVLEKNEE